MLLAKRELELAECRYHLKLMTSMYENIASSTTWRFTAPIRGFLDAVKKRDFNFKTFAESLQRAVSRIVKAPRQDWVEAANACDSNVAIMPAAFAEGDPTGQVAQSLVKFLADQGYLVIHATSAIKRCNSSTATLKAVPSPVIIDRSASHPNVIKVPFHELLSRAGCLQPRNPSQAILFVTIPAKNLIECLPAFRLAGFSVVYCVIADWSALHDTGDADWYEREVEEQAVLYADVVSVMSLKLKDTFSHLRSDIFYLGNDSHNAEQCQVLLGQEFNRLLTVVTNESVIKGIYA
ncbi:hypothetical protein Geob_1460 [Geotalea daltonii FRC-32]|uniref:Uncharacterized protein n=2 Tax=Geotalea TaxID=2910589 RepID=B9M564_GEODF|nr:hypothetical protein Geob_1460 [Geotalea daltonii FRC-32]